MRRMLVTLLLWCSAAHAHDARPVSVAITETLPGIFSATLRVPPTVANGNLPALVWPAACTVLPGASPQAGARETAPTSGSTAMRCERGLRGAQFRLDYPAFNPSLATFYRLQALDAVPVSALLAPNEVVWTVPDAATRGGIARDYLLLGIEHIIGGLDHLLFVLGLLVIARTPRRILVAITGFTLAHSLTLSLSSLGLVSVPIAPVEAVIALSILFLAHEIASPRADSLAWRQPLLVSFGFGLLHGLGFASALGEIGLARDDLVVSLLFFNLGVELGQVLFILAVVALVAAIRVAAARLERARPTVPSPSPPGGDVATRRMDMLAAYIIGVPSAYWLVERVAGFL